MMVATLGRADASVLVAVLCWRVALLLMCGSSCWSVALQRPTANHFPHHHHHTASSRSSRSSQQWTYCKSAALDEWLVMMHPRSRQTVAQVQSVGLCAG